MNKDNLTTDAAELRRQAEELARSKEAEQQLDLETLTPDEARRTLHELLVHQIELEMQNAALRKAQVELDAERERYFNLYDLAPVGYCTISEQGLILKANLMVSSLLGVARGALINRPFSQFVFKDDQESYYLHRKRIFIVGESHKFELRLVKTDGTPFWARLEAVAGQDASGTPECRVVISDINELERAREAISIERVILRDILESTLAGYWDWNLRDNTEYLSPMFKRMFGYEDHELDNSPETWQKLAHPDDLPGVFERFRLHVESRGQVPFYNELRYQHRNGSWVWVICCGRVVEWAQDGLPLRMVGCHIDITERKQLARTLEDKVIFQRLIIAGAGGAIWDWDVQNKRVAFSAKWKRMRGYGDDEIDDREENWSSTIHPEDAPRVSASLDEHLCGRTPRYSAEYRVRRKDGRYIWISDHGMALRDESGQVVRMAGSEIDITERVMAQEALLLAKDQAEVANLAKSEFLANMSHEIRTPLNGMLGMLQVMQMGVSQQEQVEYTNLALASGTRLLNLLNDVLNFSRMEAGQQGILCQNSFSTHELFTSVEEVFRPTGERKGLCIDFDIDPDTPSCLVGDERRIRQVLFNLIGNAIKFTHEGSVKVSAWTRRAQLRPNITRLYIAVKDTGIGILQDKIPHIFNRFTQADASYTRPYEGAGLGLAIVKHLVDLMEGDITVETELGQGTTIYVHLPLHTDPDGPEIQLKDVCLAKPPPARPDRTVQVEALTETRPLRILVVEDELLGQKSISLILQNFGHSVDCVNNGCQAVDAVREKDFDCVFMDVQMPEMNGLVATQNIRALGGARGATYIIALTAYALPGDREKFLAAGMDAYLSKPVLVEEIEKALVQVVEKMTKRITQ